MNLEQIPKTHFLDIKGKLIIYNKIIDKIIKITNREYEKHQKETIFEQCVIKIEDKYYYSHSGIDYRFIPRVIRQLIKNERIGGISTIEQQYIRTLLNKKERTLRRKINEWALAYILSHRVSKIEILRSYLSCAYFGYNLHSSYRASNVLFHKNPDDLNLEEAAFISSLLVYPLPKIIIDFINNEEPSKIENIENFISRSKKISPKWSKNISRRWKYAMHLYHNSKKPL